MSTQKEWNGRRPSRKGVFVVAGILIAVGLLFLGRNLGWVDGHLFGILVSWQSLLVVLGILLLLSRRIVRGFLLIGVGGFFLVPAITGAGAGWTHIYWPVLIVLAGLLLLFGRFGRRGRHRRWGHPYRGARPGFSDPITGTEDGFVRSGNTFGAERYIVLDPVFKGGELRNNFGGTVLDLRRTSLPEGDTVIDVELSFGGIEIYVPDNWVIVSELESILGGVEDKRYGVISAPATGNSRLVIRGNVTFGGVVIKN